MDLKVFFGDINCKLKKGILQHLGLNDGKIEMKVFPSGEHYVHFEENIRGADIFLVSRSTNDVNGDLMQLLILSDAARRASAERITAVIPRLFYQRQERKDKSRVPISAKLIMDILEASGINRVVTMDMHAPQIAGFTNLPFDHLQFRPILLDAVKGLGIGAVIAPDVGAVKRSEEIANKLDVDLAIISKKRKSATEVEASQFIGDVNDKTVLIVDDLTESVGTLAKAGETAKKNGAKQVIAAVTHGCFTTVGKERLIKALESKSIDRFFYSNTVDALDVKKDIPWGLEGYLTELDVAPLFGKAIYSIHNNESISSLFV